MPSRWAVRMMRTAISPRLAIRIRTALHPVHDAGARPARVLPGREREAQTEHVPRIDGIDEPVVPEPGCRVVGVGLRRVLRTDLRAQLLDLFRRDRRAPHARDADV